MAINPKNDHPENFDAGQQAKAAAAAADRSTASGPQETIDRETRQGFRGVEVDSTPNENYTLQGVTSGAPTPETDQGQAEQVRKDQKDVEAQANGVAQR
jgi:hypothetical protein